MNQFVDFYQVSCLLRYEPDTGYLYWLERPSSMFATSKAALTWNARFAEKRAFTALESGGYLHGKIWGRAYKAHRVAWLLFHRIWPVEEIDHLDGVKTNNQISNLRDCTGSENSKNRLIQKNNTSGIAGVCWDARSRKWEAYFYSHRTKVSLGRFSSKAEAVAIRQSAVSVNGFTTRHGAIA